MSIYGLYHPQLFEGRTIYIGQTISSLNVRLSKHKAAAKLHVNTPLYNLMINVNAAEDENKNIEAWNIRLIEQVDNIQELTNREKFYIHNDPLLINKNYKKTPEELKNLRIGRARNKYILDPETYKNKARQWAQNNPEKSTANVLRSQYKKKIIEYFNNLNADVNADNINVDNNNNINNVNIDNNVNVVNANVNVNANANDYLPATPENYQRFKAFKRAIKLNKQKEEKERIISVQHARTQLVRDIKTFNKIPFVHSLMNITL